MDEEFFVEFIKPRSQPHELERILELHTCNHICCQVLVKWKDYPKDGVEFKMFPILRRDS